MEDQGRPSAALVPLDTLEPPTAPVSSIDVGSNGWTQNTGGDTLTQYWLEPWPATEDVIAAGRAHPPNMTYSTIYDEYDNGGLDHRQWINLTHDRAAICVADRTWKVGGAYHFWYYPGGGRTPFEFKEFVLEHRYPADQSAWMSVRDSAFEAAENYLGFVR